MPPSLRKFLKLLAQIRIPLHSPLDCTVIFNEAFTILALGGISLADEVTRRTATFILKGLPHY
jgi:hypothetical protein